MVMMLIDIINMNDVKYVYRVDVYNLKWAITIRMHSKMKLNVTI